jgi:hypothetical protein
LWEKKVNKAEIKNKIAEWSHRTDLTNQLDTFVDNTTQRLNNRLGLALVLSGAGDENVISRDYPNIYIYGGLREMATYVRDRVAQQDYEQMYQAEVASLNINAESEGFTDDVPVMLNEYEQEIADANS